MRKGNIVTCAFSLEHDSFPRQRYSVYLVNAIPLAMKKSSYCVCFVLSAVLLFTSCSTSRNFFQQKYTDFGHRPHTHDTRENKISTSSSSSSPAPAEQAVVTDSVPSEAPNVPGEKSVQRGPDSLPVVFPVNTPPLREESGPISTDVPPDNTTSRKPTASAPMDGPLLIPVLLIALFLSLFLIVFLLIGGGNEVLLGVLMIVFVLILLTLIVTAVWGVLRFLRDKKDNTQ